MRALMLSCVVTLSLACAKTDRDAATDSAAGAAEVTPAPTISLADVAGRWNVAATPLSGDTSVIRYQLNATADATGWTFTPPGRSPVPVSVVSVTGDSIVIAAGPFESMRRAGVQVNTQTVLRKQGDRLVGTTYARYVTSGPDSTLQTRVEATRAP
jgi:hypothetical protein